ncbi:MAG: class I SAM-dependent methyltransferase [Phycisphaerales bacterium]|nr:MAG: class I SAM-dependent methyltransferase [Phycisphaerales bacterium]
MDKGYQLETFRLESEHWWYRARQRIILDQLGRRLSMESRPRILDIGCGAGTMLQAMREFGEVVGVDACTEAAEAAEGHSSCVVRVGHIPDDLPHDLGRFNAVCLFDVIEHLDDDIGALRSVRDLLDSDGVLFVTVPALPRLYGIHDEINEHRRRYTRSSLLHALTAAGFPGAHISYFNMLLSPLLIPAIFWRNLRRAGHNFEVRSRLAPILERVFGAERILMRHTRLPFGLSLLATAEPARSEPSTIAVGDHCRKRTVAQPA